MNLYYKLLTTFLFVITLGINSNAQTFSGEIGVIPDTKEPKRFLLNVNNLKEERLTSHFGIKSLCLSIEHPYVQNLQIRLSSPDGTQVLFVQNNGGSGDNFTNTCFNDFASSVQIQQGVAPFNGSYKPIQEIGRFNNSQFGNGIWTLEIIDDALFDVGSLLSWELNFEYDVNATELLNSNLPILLINTDGQSILDSGSTIMAHLNIINTNNRNSTFDTITAYTGNIKIGVQGNFLEVYPQKTYSVETYNSLASNDSNVALLNLPEAHEWILLANYNDKSFIRNMLMYQLSRDMGHYASNMKPCEVIINGDYIGVYLLVEKISVGANRVNISLLDSLKNDSTSITGGYLFAHDYKNAGWDSKYAPAIDPSKFYHFNFEYPSATNITLQQAQYLKEYVDKFQTKLFNQDLTYYNDIEIGSFIDYFICAEFSWNENSYQKSMYFYKDRLGKLIAGPISNFDFGFKRGIYTTPDFAGWNYDIENYGNTISTIPWWIYFMKDSNFRNETRCRWETLRGSILSIKNLNTNIDSMANIFKESEVRHYKRWPILGKSVGTPEQEPFSKTYEEEIIALKEMILKRINWIDDNLNGNCTLYPKKLDISVYPNPVSNNLTIILKRNPLEEALKNVTIKKIVISNLISNCNEFEFTQNTKEAINVDVHSLEQGIYILKVIDSTGENYTSKFYKY